MDKLIYALTAPTDHDPESWSAALRGPVAQELSAAGARGVQVNVVDSSVAGAQLDLPPADRRVDGVVTVWIDGAGDGAGDDVRRPLEECLGRAAARVAGWQVTERLPIDPPTVALGERTPGLSNLAFINRAAALTEQEWLDYWRQIHTGIAIDYQDTFGYVQNTVVRAVTDDVFPADAIVEELFPIEGVTSGHARYGSGGDPEELTRRQTIMLDSCAKFLGPTVAVVPSSRFVVTTPEG